MEEGALRFPNLWAVLQKYGEAARNRYREKLTKEGKNASNDLFNSVKYKVKQNGTFYEVALDLAFYWKFVEGGTKGKKYPSALCKQHFPPVTAIARWVEVKPIIPRPDKDGKIPTPETLAFLIARKIARDGIKPAPIMEQTSAEIYAEFSDKVAEAFQKDCLLFSDAVFLPFLGLNTGK